MDSIFDLNVALGLEDLPVSNEDKKLSDDEYDDHFKNDLFEEFKNENDEFSNGIKDEEEECYEFNKNEESECFEGIKKEEGQCGEANKNEKKDVDDDVETNAAIDRRNKALMKELEEKLNVGTCFGDLEQVYLLYCEYARCCGFSVRKGDQRYFGRNMESIRWKQFECSSAGLPNYRSIKHRLALYKKLVIRTDCKAALIVSREDMGAFRVTKFVTEHNHLLVRHDQSYLLRSSRNLSYAKKSVLEALTSVGIRVSTACKFMEKESGGPQNVGFIRKDAYHHMDKLKKPTRVEDGDAWSLVDHFSNKKLSEPFFFWKYQKDESGKILNIFWRDTRCAVDYDAFGDVISVDTTYKTNRYRLVCAPFVGINHHSMNVMFGMAFMSDETTSSFIWLFETFLEAMQGKQPKMIFTDQCRAMMNAIDVCFPKAKHRLCQWHISRSCAQNFGLLNGDASFKRLFFKCMNIVESKEEFDETWGQMMQNYKIPNPNWYKKMHDNRHRWASVFSRGLFSAGLLAISWSESTNHVLKTIVKSSNSLTEVVIHAEEIQKTWRSKESAEDAYAIWLPGQVIEENSLLVHAASVYTRSVYKEFERALGNTFNVALGSEVEDLGDGKIEYTARDKRVGHRERKVVFNTTTNVATCSCCLYESEGKICSHILMIFHFRDVRSIPESMILRRWTKRAKTDQQNMLGVCDGEESSVMKYMMVTNETMRHLYEICSSGLRHDKARGPILERLRCLRSEFEELISSLTAEDSAEPKKSREKLRDPKKILERAFAAARKRKHGSTKATTPKAKKAKNSTAKNGKSPQTEEKFDGDPFDGMYDETILSL